jgi:hypothetical protein
MPWRDDPVKMLVVDDEPRLRGLSGEPEPPPMIVTDLQGGCANAVTFRTLEGRTLEEAWALIQAALDASERLQPSCNCPSGEPGDRMPAVTGTTWSATRTEVASSTPAAPWY